MQEAELRRRQDEEVKRLQQLQAVSWSRSHHFLSAPVSCIITLLSVCIRCCLLQILEFLFSVLPPPHSRIFTYFNIHKHLLLIFKYLSENLTFINNLITLEGEMSVRQ